MQCPDPHFKKRHHKRRVVQKTLVDNIISHLVPGGKVFVLNIHSFTWKVNILIAWHVVFNINGFSFKRETASLFPWRRTWQYVLPSIMYKIRILFIHHTHNSRTPWFLKTNQILYCYSLGWHGSQNFSEKILIWIYNPFMRTCFDHFCWCEMISLKLGRTWS